MLIISAISLVVNNLEYYLNGVKVTLREPGIFKFDLEKKHTDLAKCYRIFCFLYVRSPYSEWNSEGYRDWRRGVEDSRDIIVLSMLSRVRIVTIFPCRVEKTKTNDNTAAYFWVYTVKTVRVYFDHFFFGPFKTLASNDFVSTRQ